MKRGQLCATNTHLLEEGVNVTLASIFSDSLFTSYGQFLANPSDEMLLERGVIVFLEADSSLKVVVEEAETFFDI